VPTKKCLFPVYATRVHVLLTLFVLWALKEGCFFKYELCNTRPSFQCFFFMFQEHTIGLLLIELGVG
jgi:hypothetical protein